VTGTRRSGPLAVRSFRLLCGGQFASTIGDYCYAVALPWLVLSAHGGALLLGAVLACYGVPRTVLIPVGGVLADKVGPRTLMLAADTARCVLVAGLAMLAARHVTSFGVSALTLLLIPLSVAVSGALVRHLGPAPFFPVAGALVGVAIMGGLTQREFRAFGARDDGRPQAATAAADLKAAVDLKAAEGSRK